MLSNISIKAKLQLAAFVSIIVVSTLVAVGAIYSINSLSEKNIEDFTKDAYTKKEVELKNYVSLAVKAVESYYKRTEKGKVKQEVEGTLKSQTGFLFSILEGEYKRLNGTIPDNILKERLRQIVKETRYGKTGYFWINDTDAVIVMHPIKPHLDGKNLYTYKDKGGKQIFKEFAAAAKKNGEGFVDYVWPKPGFEKPQDKVSFVKLFAPYNWVVGTGEYVANVTENMQKEALLRISEERYGKNGYFWINNSTPEMVMHPIKPALNGKNLSKVKDAAGKLLFNEMSKVANANVEGGLVKYMWAKPGKDTPQPKYSFVQRFGPWDWIIGTGAYVDDIEESITAMKEATDDEIMNVITTITLFSLGAILFIYFLSAFLINKAIITPLVSLNNAVKYLITNQDRRESIRKTSNDEIGQVVDSFNEYLKKLADVAKQDEKVIEEVEDVITKVNNGFYVYKVHANSENEQVQKLKNSINSMIDQTSMKLEEINKTLLEYGSSNFTEKRDSDETKISNGIIGSITTSTYLLGSTVSEFLSMITTSGTKLNSDTNVLSSEVDKLAKSANEQAASLEETAAAIEQITGIIQNNSEKVGQMSVLANELNTSASDGEDLAAKTTQAMEDIDNQVNSINDAITVIDQIAFQTNILSLNAAVEAATAGEAGKGFAVVAQEVRNLASRSAEAAKEIKGIVEAATNKANEGKSIANNMSSGYSTLNARVSETIKLISDVTDGSKEQEAGIIQINDAINSLDRATQINASSASEINSLSDEVLVLSRDLLSIADRAKYDESKKSGICDIDMVFNISKLKNDHILFKNNNFAKVGEKGATSWSVTKDTECDLGLWIIEQERNGQGFTRSSNWSILKESHANVHNGVQEYIDVNANKGSNEELLNISGDIEVATNRVFESLDGIKVDYCVTYAPKADKKQVEERVYSTPTREPVSAQRSVPSSRPTRVEPVTTTSSAKVITANNSDDDEWESF